MSFRVVIDSCGELTDEMKKSGNFVSAPLTLQVDEYIVQDDEEHFNQAEFLKKSSGVSKLSEIFLPITGNIS